MLHAPGRQIRRTLSPAALAALARPHQWIKNAFVAAPLLFTPEALTGHAALVVLTGMAVFSVLASAVYILNDYFDREADRLHPVKRHRPLASGQVSPGEAWSLCGLLLAVGLSGAALLDLGFLAAALAYLALNLAYSLVLKNVAILDVLTIALGFALRVQAGGILTDIAPSSWLLGLTMLLALFLALAKRRDDLVRRIGGDHRRSLDGYNKPFLDTALAVLLGATLVAYMIYTADPDVVARLGTDKLHYTTPFVILGMLRYLQITLVEERSGSPTRLVVSDRILLLSIVGWALTFGILIYG